MQSRTCWSRFQTVMQTGAKAVWCNKPVYFIGSMAATAVSYAIAPFFGAAAAGVGASSFTFAMVYSVVKNREVANGISVTLADNQRSLNELTGDEIGRNLIAQQRQLPRSLPLAISDTAVFCRLLNLLTNLMSTVTLGTATYLIVVGPEEKDLYTTLAGALLGGFAIIAGGVSHVGTAGVLARERAEAKGVGIILTSVAATKLHLFADQNVGHGHPEAKAPAVVAEPQPHDTTLTRPRRTSSQSIAV